MAAWWSTQAERAVNGRGPGGPPRPLAGFLFCCTFSAFNKKFPHCRGVICVDIRVPPHSPPDLEVFVYTSIFEKLLQDFVLFCLLFICLHFYTFLLISSKLSFGCEGSKSLKNEFYASLSSYLTEKNQATNKQKTKQKQKQNKNKNKTKTKTKKQKNKNPYSTIFISPPSSIHFSRNYIFLALVFVFVFVLFVYLFIFLLYVFALISSWHDIFEFSTFLFFPSFSSFTLRPSSFPFIFSSFLFVFPSFFPNQHHFLNLVCHLLRAHFSCFCFPGSDEFQVLERCLWKKWNVHDVKEWITTPKEWSHSEMNNRHSKRSSIKGVLRPWALFLETLCIFSKNKATSDKMFQRTQKPQFYFSRDHCCEVTVKNVQKSIFSMFWAINQ